MNRGSVLFWPDFEYHDGCSSNKLMVVLNSADAGDPVLLFKTTSQQKRRDQTPGCNANRQEFFLLPEKDEFLKNTWIILNEVYAYSLAEMLKAGLQEKKFEVKCVLTENKADSIRDCALSCQDIERKWKKLLLK